jgi:hypothetical protein
LASVYDAARMDLTALSQLADCETVGDGWLAQPINAWSSLAFTTVGIGVALSAGATSNRERTDRVVFGTVLIATGLGSFLYHGPRPATARFLHDLTLLGALWYLVVANLTGALGTPGGTRALLAAGGIATIAAVLLIDTDSTILLTAALAVCLLASDVVMWRHAPPRPVWYAVAIGAFAVAVGLLLAGRTGSPLCDPDGLRQGHAGWHVLSAAALGAYFIATTPARMRASA